MKTKIRKLAGLGMLCLAAMGLSPHETKAQTIKQIWTSEHRYMKAPAGSPNSYHNLPLGGTLPAELPDATIITSIEAMWESSHINPGLTTNWNYEGTVSDHPTNAAYDANDQLLFFVSEGYVYDSKGYLITPLLFEDEDMQFLMAKGHNAVIILPVPGSCCEYYIITSQHWSYGGETDNYVVYQKINMCERNRFFPNDPERYGNAQFMDTYDYGFPLCKVIDKLRVSGYRSSMMIPPPLESFGIAVTPKIPIGTYINQHFLFTVGKQYINTYAISDIGITNVTSNFDMMAFQAAKSGILSEVEVFDNGNGTYKIACGGMPIKEQDDLDPSTPPILHYDWYHPVCFYNCNNSGSISNAGMTVLTINDTEPLYDDPELIRGVEFSPDGEIIYASFRTRGIFIGAIGVGALYPLEGSLPSPPVSTADYGNGHIEKTFRRDMIFNAQDKIAQIDNANNPSTSSWTGNILPSFTPAATQSLTNSTYLFPYKIDQFNMNYILGTAANSPCCTEATVYNRKFFKTATGTYSAPLTQTWDHTSNPFGVTGTAPVTIFIKDGLEFSSYNNITINNIIFKFAPDAKMVINKNTKITATNSIFTSVDCNGKMWQGIEMIGDNTLNQTTTPHTSSVARNPILVMTNSEVNNAIIGISAAKRSATLTFVANTGGATIQATDSRFKNNYVDVDFEPYTLTATNLSVFTRTKFLTNGLTKDPGYPVESGCHIRLIQTTSMRFFGCEIANQNLTPYPNVYSRGIGIYAYDSKLYWDKDVTVTPNINGVFTNLQKGIYAISISPLRNTVCMNSNFTNVAQGIYISGSEVDAITNNTFDVGPTYSQSGTTYNSYGVYLYFCTGYSIYQNSFTTNYNGYYGLYIHHSGTAVNRVYKNNFSKFFEASVAAAVNDGSTDGDGLDYVCNNFSLDKTVDIGVVGGGMSEPDAINNVGISDYQGFCSFLPSTSIPDPASPANNTFTDPKPSVGTLWQNSIPGSAVEDLTYTFAQSTVYETDPSLGIVGAGSPINTVNTLLSNCSNPPTSHAHLTALNYDAACPAVTEGGGGMLAEISIFRDIIAENTLKIDGGNTNGLLDRIHATASENELRHQLKQYSPYLSDEVLIALITKTPSVSAQTIHEILLPQYPLGTKVLQALVATKQPVHLLHDAFISSRPVQKEAMISLINMPGATEWMVKDVMIANSPLTNEELNALILQTPTYSNEMVKQVLAVNNGDQKANHRPVSMNAVNELEKENAYFKRRIALNENQLISHFLNIPEPSGQSLDSLSALLETFEPGNERQQFKVLLAIERGKTVHAKKLMASLSPSQENEQFIRLANRIIELNEAPEKGYKVTTDPALMAELASLAEGNNKIGNRARAVLEAFMGYPSRMPMYGVEKNGENTIVTWEETPKMLTGLNNNIVLYPNPNNGSFTFEYYPDYNGTLTSIVIYDITGKRLSQSTIQVTAGSAYNFKGDFNTGIYLVELTDNFGITKTIKMSVEK